jgi:acyl-coenzyme A thioesterase PaaI-like protein
MSARSGPFWDVVKGREPMPRAAATLGLEFVDADVEAGTIELAFKATEAVTNPAGNVLGAFAAAMLYDTVGTALLATLSPDQFQSTLQLNVSFLRSARAPVQFVAVDSSDVSRWFGEYLDAFAACGRGEEDTASLLAYYGVPLLITTDGGFFTLTSEDQVVAAVQPQIDGMRAAGYHRSEILGSEVTVLNSASALYRGMYSYHRRDGGQISRVTVTYLVTDGAAGRRISVLAVHSP